MKSIVLYSISDGAVSLVLPFLLLILPLFGVILLRWSTKANKEFGFKKKTTISPRSIENSGKFIGWLFLIFGCAISIFAIYFSFSEYYELKNALQSGDYQIFSGKVSEEEYGDHPKTIKVGEQVIMYKSELFSPAFKGPILTGTTVKKNDSINLYLHNDKIIYLEITE